MFDTLLVQGFGPEAKPFTTPIPVSRTGTTSADRHTPKATDILEVDGLVCSFGGIRALDSASFSVRAGVITGVIGPNGAGKTTLFNCVTGLQAKSGGRVKFAETDVSQMRPDEISGLGLTRTFQLARGCPRMREMSIAVALILLMRMRPQGLLSEFNAKAPSGNRTPTSPTRAGPRPTSMPPSAGLSPANFAPPTET